MVRNFALFARLGLRRINQILSGVECTGAVFRHEDGKQCLLEVIGEAGFGQDRASRILKEFPVNIGAFDV